MNQRNKKYEKIEYHIKGLIEMISTIRALTNQTSTSKQQIRIIDLLYIKSNLWMSA